MASKQSGKIRKLIDLQNGAESTKASSAKRAAKRSHSVIRESSLENCNPKKKKKNTPNALDSDNNAITNKKSKKRTLHKKRKPKQTNRIQCNNDTGNKNHQNLNNIDKNADTIFSDISFESENEEDNVLVVSLPNEPKEDIEIEIENLKVKKQRRFNWKTLKEYESLDEAIEYLETEGFVLFDDRDLLCGQKFYYRCKRIPQAKLPWCAKRFILFLPSNENKIILQANGEDHDHDDLLSTMKKRPLSDEMKSFLEQLFKNGTTLVLNVLSHIDTARKDQNLFTKESNPDSRQIEYQLKKFRASEIKPMVCLGDLMSWCQSNTMFPEDVNTPFVLGYESSSLSQSLAFKFCITTPLLLRTFIGKEIVCIDATYKLNWLGFPLIVFGIVDRSKKFHPLVYSCVTNETANDYAYVFRTVENGIETYFKVKFEPTTLIADGADAIRNAFYEVFESATLDVMCFAHVIRNVLKRPFTSRNSKQLIKDDINKMQLAANPKIFETMSTMFCCKWKDLEPNFIEYFRKEWLGVHCNWFEGAAVYTPSTNNALESHNAQIKRKVTLRKRLPLNQFLIAMRDLTGEISMQFSDGRREFAIEPTLKKEAMIEAAIMYQNNFKSFKGKKSSNGQMVLVIPSQSCEEEYANELYYKSLVNRQWTSFDEFIQYGFNKFYIVMFSVSSWKQKSMCTCPAFFKEHICKHIAAVALKEKIIQCPEYAKPTLLARTRMQSGRPKGAKKALIHQ